MKNTLIFLLLITLGSCEDFFETTIKVDPPDFTTQLVVHMYINDLNDTLKAGVGKSIGSLATVNSQDDFLINDAIVQLKNNNGEVIYELNNIEAAEDSNINYALVLNSNFNGDDQLFKLEISHPVLGKATAEQTMPRPVVISEPKFKKDAGVDVDGFKYSTVNFKIHDPAGQENYYQIKILFSDETEDRSYYIGSWSNDPIFSVSYDSDALLLSDKTFDGKDFPVKIPVNVYSEDDFQDKLFIEIKGISKDFYLYARSMNIYQESDDFGFSEPVSVYNNIINGLGIFSLSSRKLYPVLF